jgi:hypothetical protein
MFLSKSGDGPDALLAWQHRLVRVKPHFVSASDPLRARRSLAWLVSVASIHYQKNCQSAGGPQAFPSVPTIKIIMLLGHEDASPFAGTRA